MARRKKKDRDDSSDSSDDSSDESDEDDDWTPEGTKRKAKASSAAQLTVKRASRAAAADDGPHLEELSDYEGLRLRNMERNAAVLQSLGLAPGGRGSSRAAKRGPDKTQKAGSAGPTSGRAKPVDSGGGAPAARKEAEPRPQSAGSRWKSGQCWQCGTSHINLWGHWSSPKTPCQPPPDPDDGITAPDDDAQLLGSYNAKTVTGVPEHDQMVANLVDMGVPEAKAVSALECCNFDLIEALTYLEQYG